MSLALTIAYGRTLGQNEAVTPAKINAVVKGLSVTIGSVTPANLPANAYWYATSVVYSNPKFTLTLNPAVTVYVDGMLIQFKLPNANPASATVDAGAGAVGIYDSWGTALPAGALPTNCLCMLAYNSSLNAGGGGWQLISARVPVPADFASSAYTSNVGGTATAITATFSPPTPSLVDGLTVRFRAASAAGNAATLNVDGLGALNIVYDNNSGTIGNIGANYFAQYSIVKVFYNSHANAWQVRS